MSRTKRNRHNATKKRRVFAPVKRMKPRMWGLGALSPRCFESGKAKVCYYTEAEALIVAASKSTPLRVYACRGHYHLTSKV